MLLFVIIKNDLDQGHTQNDPSEFVSPFAEYIQCYLFQSAKAQEMSIFP